MKQKYWAIAAALAAVLNGGSVALFGQDAPPDPGALFQRLDKNGDGKITAGEIPEDQARFFERLVRRGDKNSDGELTREEFDQANKPEERPNVPLGPAAGGDGRGDARQRFEMLDRNKDGKVTLDEVPEPLRERIKPIFDRLGKQEVTLDEFQRFAAGPGPRPEPGALFKRFDANSDGKLTKDEIPAEMRERLAPVFERLGKEEIGQDEFVQFMERMRDAAGRPGQGFGNPEELFGRLDTNSDGKITIDEVPERMRPLAEGVFRRAGKERDGSLTKEEFVKNLQPPMPREGERRPEGAAPRDGERRPEGDRPRDAERRPDGEQPRTGERRPDAAPSRDGAPRDGAPRENGRRPDGARPRDGERPGEMRGDGRGPQFMRLLDTNRDGRISKEELQKAGEIFDELDRNHDGQLDPAELLGGPAGGPDGRTREGNRDAAPRTEGARRESERPAGRPEGDAPGRDRRPDAPAERGAFFQRLDRDGDGKISKDEAPEMMKDRFSMIDTNGDGFISQDELRTAASLFGDRPRRPPEGRPEGRPEQPKKD